MPRGEGPGSQQGCPVPRSWLSPIQDQAETPAMAKPSPVCSRDHEQPSTAAAAEPSEASLRGHWRGSRQKRRLDPEGQALGQHCFLRPTLDASICLPVEIPESSLKGGVPSRSSPLPTRPFRYYFSLQLEFIFPIHTPPRPYTSLVLFLLFLCAFHCYLKILHTNL